MSFTRKVSLITGVAFIITFVASIPAAFYFYTPVLDHADYILGAGADARIGWGAFLEVILVVANVATAVALYPVVKRQNEGVALGYVAARTFESTMIAVGIIAMLAVVTLQAGSRGSRRRRRFRRSRAVARRGPRLDVPARAGHPPGHRQRLAAGLPDVPLRARAEGHGHAWGWSPAPC